MEFFKNFSEIFKDNHFSDSTKNDLIETIDIENRLLKYSKVTPLIRNINKENGIKLYINENERHGYANQESKIITIGDQTVPENIKEQWGLSNTNDEFIKSYMFSHENNHHVVWYMFKNQDKFPMFARLYNNLKALREGNLEQGKYIGLSQIGSTKINNNYFYYNNTIDKNGNKGHTAHDEDLVELLNKYCMNPTNFKQYLSYLVNTDKDILNEKGLVKISQDVADWLFEDISIGIALFLKENGKIQHIK